MRFHWRARSAFSVVEVLVALMLVSVGLLGMAGTSALSLRTAATAARERRATRRATTRLAILAAAGCGRARSGALDESDLRERWTVAPPRDGMSLVEVSIDWRERGPEWRSMLLPSAVLC
jgi:type II secretory pathway pseudopilin PulG